MMMLDVVELDPVLIAGQRCRRFRTGAGRHPTKYVNVWRPDVVRDHNGDPITEDRDGLKLGPYFRVKRLPISPRHNGGAGFTLVDGRPHYSPAFYHSLGWLPMERLPKGWQEHNERIHAEKRRRAHEEYEKTPMGRMEKALAAQGRTTEALIQAIGSQAQGVGEVVREAVQATAEVAAQHHSGKSSGGSRGKS